jgi:bifunctional aspartokinase / homoserine dehydrogenase 1
MKPLVMKFGGTSVGSPAAMRRSAQLVAAQVGCCDGIVVVVSALNGITNLLIECATQAAHASLDQLETGIQAYYDRHAHLIEALQIDRQEKTELFFNLEQRTGQLRTILASIQQAGHLTPALQDAAASLGERMSAPILAALLRQNSIHACEMDAAQLIVTDANYTQAAVQFDATNRNIITHISPLLEKGIIPVVTGFIGATPTGQVTTLGRGASDYSSTILAAALNASEIWNWTDVDGVYNADPHLVPQANVFSFLSYETMSILAKYGAKVLHPETLRPVSRLGIPIRVRNSFNPDTPGTLIQSNQILDPLSSLAIVNKSNPTENIDGFVSLNDTDPVREIINPSLISVIGGILDTNKVVSILTDAGLTVLASLLQSSDGCVSVVVRSEDTTRAVQVLYNCLIEKPHINQEDYALTNAWLALSEFNAVQK